MGVVGAGQMGRGITEVAACAGLKVLLYDSSKDASTAGLDFIKRRLTKGIEKKKWEAPFVHEVLGRIACVEKIEDISPVDLVIEAVVEDEGAKCALFGKLDTIVSPECILASNTSSISITEMAAKTKDPGRFVGMHFMNPVPVMKLVEGVRGEKTRGETMETIRNLALTMGKVFIEAKDRPGFAVNRILMPMINEAIYALQEGVASAEDIDQAMVLGASWPMGPLRLADFIGLDTCLSIMIVLHRGFDKDKYRPCPLLEGLVDQGRLGKKSGKGFYSYGK